jgi:predicted phage gp36 major capsid-like protein
MHMKERLTRLLEERGRLWESEQKPLVEVEGRALNADEQQKWDDITSRMSKLDKDIEEAQRAYDAEKAAGEARDRYDALGVDGGRQTREGQRPERELRLHEREEYRDAFERYCRHGMSSLEGEQRNLIMQGAQSLSEDRAQSTGTGSAGGFLIPQGFYNQLTVAMKAYGGMVPYRLGIDGDGGPTDGDEQAGTSLIETETGNDLPFPTMNDTANTGARLAENATITQQDIAFGAVTLKAWTYTSKLILVPWALLQDSYFSLDSFIADAAGQRLGRILNTELTTGTGSGASMPNGVVTASGTGKTLGGATATPTYDDLIDLQHSVNRAYRRNGKFMFNDLSLAVLRKLKDSQNRPLWEPNFEADAPALFAGKRYVVNDDMATVGTTGVKSVLFGDFSFYKVRIARGMSLIRLEERYADALQTGFFVWMRADGNLIDGGGSAIKAIVNP